MSITTYNAPWVMSGLIDIQQRKIVIKLSEIEQVRQELPFILSGEYRKNCDCEHCKSMPTTIEIAISIISDYKNMKDKYSPVEFTRDIAGQMLKHRDDSISRLQAEVEEFKRLLGRRSDFPSKATCNKHGKENEYDSNCEECNRAQAYNYAIEHSFSAYINMTVAKDKEITELKELARISDKAHDETVAGMSSNINDNAELYYSCKKDLDRLSALVKRYEGACQRIEDLHLESRSDHEVRAEMCGIAREARKSSYTDKQALKVSEEKV